MAIDVNDDVDGAAEGVDEDELGLDARPTRDSRAFAVAVVALASVGLLAAFVLTIERLALIADPSYVPSCSFNPILTCTSVMTSPQAALFGFPNPLIGVMTFPVVIATGAALLAGARLARWYWLGLQAGVTLAVVFIHWLIVSSLYSIGALCPYCMVVWAVTIPLFVIVTERNLRLLPSDVDSPWARAGRWVQGYRTPILVLWFLLVIGAIAVRFWDFWITLF
ncbi:vitamin K epoxide reductase family protein [Litorihabitans aurantiacus]|uniref:Membrane protein n=1 Tax=Litorihabitans aurantiacus TaxID=1930061 RepID=A0AA37XGR4_9MICO|nr:vitamin K epoxide reductase family protein [Litorihabitans aurantiacus]GMA33031.1 membrane protein [Litorihabitans aurantiacus]